jgi:hypothetical protein
MPRHATNYSLRCDRVTAPERMRVLTTKQHKERAETMVLAKELERQALSVRNQRELVSCAEVRDRLAGPRSQGQTITKAPKRRPVNPLSKERRPPGPVGTGGP